MRDFNKKEIGVWANMIPNEGFLPPMKFNQKKLMAHFCGTCANNRETDTICLLCCNDYPCKYVKKTWWMKVIAWWFKLGHRLGIVK